MLEYIHVRFFAYTRTQQVFLWFFFNPSDSCTCWSVSQHSFLLLSSSSCEMHIFTPHSWQSGPACLPVGPVMELYIKWKLFLLVFLILPQKKRSSCLGVHSEWFSLRGYQLCLFHTCCQSLRKDFSGWLFYVTKTLPCFWHAIVLSGQTHR